jgi:NAD(P) transhydrogenase
MGYDYDLVCIGSGPAGQRAAVQAAKAGRRAAVIEKRGCVGGVCVDTGTIPSKTLREAVLAYAARAGAAARRAPGPATARPTAGDLLSGVESVMAREIEVIEHQLARNDVRLIRGEATFVDPHTLSVLGAGGTATLTAEHVLIAVGTRPASPPGVKADGEIVLDSDDVLRLGQLPRAMAVVGAGVIGVEYASMFAALGVQVTVVERRERPLEFLDHEIVDELIHQLRNRNVTFRLGESVESLAVSDGPPRRAMLLLESGKRLVADVVLFSAGRIAATDGLNLAAVGIEPDERGRLAVDAQFRTAVPHIFAAGDVIGHPSLAATSFEQGRLAACHAFGIATPPMTPHFPIGIYAIPEISMVGPSERTLTAERVPYETGVARYREIARGQILGDESGFLKLLFHREDRRLLAAHCLGSGATELVHIGQAVLSLGGGLDYFLESVFNYPTLAECYKVAALDAGNKLRA